jgi:hypothetical protein
MTNINDRIITFESYYEPMLAQIICTRLLANGISCFIADDGMLCAKPYYNQLLGGVKIKIFENDLDKCYKVLATKSTLPDQDYFKIDSEINNIITECPHCGSNNVRYGQATIVKFHLPSVLLTLFFWVPCYFRSAWHCFNCYRDF